MVYIAMGCLLLLQVAIALIDRKARKRSEELQSLVNKKHGRFLRLNSDGRTWSQICLLDVEERDRVIDLDDMMTYAITEIWYEGEKKQVTLARLQICQAEEIEEGEEWKYR